MNFWLAIVAAFMSVVYVITSGYKSLRIFFATFPRDIRVGYAYFGAKYYIYNCKKRNLTATKIFQRLVKKYPNKVAFYYKDQEWTYEQLDQFSNKVANCVTNLGYQWGDEIALLMNSRPEFVGIWLGLAKAGIVTAFINTNQKLETLVHSITAVNCKAVIVENHLVNSVEEIAPLIIEKQKSFEFFVFGELSTETHTKEQFIPIHQLISESSNREPDSIERGNFDDKLYYIFTSGTTGLPKAAVIRNHRYIWMGLIVRKLYKFSRDDILYITLPLYHNNAGTIGSSQSVLFGTSIVLRDRFSASHFWDDCIKYHCTGAMYIGEICRYLLAQPIKSTDNQHKVRIMFGNGLRPKVWAEFIKRFNVEQIGEFYGSTEGNANVANYDFKFGACGIIPCCIPIICKRVYPVTLIKVNPETGDHIRDERGLCVIARPGEVGEIVGKIQQTDPSKAYPGYASEEATRKKIVRDVFQFGDQAFLSGDLMKMDEYGYLYFMDRTGDTYRWKGENVSTSEVEAVVQMVTQLSDCVVFGVPVGQCEGKAGMAVIAKSAGIDIANMAAQLAKHLPAFAVPMFVRLVESIEITGSYKLSKYNVEREGYDPSVIKDEIYFLDKFLNTYVRLDPILYEKLQNGEILL